MPIPPIADCRLTGLICLFSALVCPRPFGMRCDRDSQKISVFQFIGNIDRDPAEHSDVVQQFFPIETNITFILNPLGHEKHTFALGFFINQLRLIAPFTVLQRPELFRMIPVIDIAELPILCIVKLNIARNRCREKRG